MKQIYLDILSTLSAEDPETGKYFNSSLCVKQTTTPFGYWNIFENCQEDALKYKTRSEWVKQSQSAYNSAWKKGWLPICCKHMNTRQTKPHGYWNTLKNCQEDALQYNTRSEWAKQSKSGYDSAVKHGWLELCCKHMVSPTKPNGYWTLENCQEDALQYNTKTEWQKQSPSAYRKACQMGWLPICTKHMVSPTKPNGYWTLENCQEDALQYTTNVEWKKQNQSAYNAAKGNGWLDICRAHMESIRKPSGFWNILENCQEDALKYNTRIEWQKQSSGAYNGSKRNGWLPQCQTQNKNKNKRNIK